MLKKTLYILLAATISTLAVQAQASRSEGETTAHLGVVRCGGNQFLRLGGSEIQFTSWTVRNFDSGTPIAIDRMRIFDGLGTVLLDSASTGLPASQNGLLGPGNNALGPNQSAIFDSTTILPGFFPLESNRPFQLEIEWSAARRVLSLDAITVRISRQRDPSAPMGQQQLAERGRHAVECRSILLK